MEAGRGLSGCIGKGRGRKGGALNTVQVAGWVVQELAAGVARGKTHGGEVGRGVQGSAVMNHRAADRTAPQKNALSGR